MVVFDTNAVLRFLLRDNEEMALHVRYVLNNATCLVPIEVVAEAVYVLTKVYRIDREQVCRSLQGFFDNDNAETPLQHIVEEAIEVYRVTKFDFVDCLMVGYAKYEGHEIVTFDKKLKRYLEGI